VTALPRVLRSAVAVASAFALVALSSSSFHVVPATPDAWRGVLDPPGTARLALAIAAGVLAGFLERRYAAVLVPLATLGVASALPLVPVATGHALPLLFFQGGGLALVAAAALGSLVVPRLLVAGPPLRPVAAFLLALAAFAGLSARLPGPAGAQGDEPHYLTMAESLRSDHDLDLRDEFRRREYRAFYPGELDAHTSPASPRGKLYAIHAPGLPALALPAYALAGEAGVRALLALAAALGAALAFVLARRVTRSETAARAALLVLVAGAPFALYADLVYPEMLGALATVTFLLLSRGDTRPASLVLAGMLAGSLVWVHPKFLPLAACGLLLVVLRPGPVGARALALALGAAGLATLLSWMNATYGTPSLSAAYGRGASEDVQLANLARGLPGLLFDREFGLLLLGPVWFLAVLGLRPLFAERAGDALRALLLAASSLGVGAAYSMWWGGSCPPGRFLVPALPALALFVGAAAPRRPRLFATLAGYGCGVLLVCALQPRALHNRADGESAFLRATAPALRVDGALPSFVGETPQWSPTSALGLRPRGAVLFALAQWDGRNVASASGRLQADAFVLPLLEPGASLALDRAESRATPRIALPPGSYEAHVRGRVAAGVVPGRLVSLVVSADEGDVARGFFDGSEAVLIFELPKGARRLEVWGTGVRPGATLDAIDLVPLRVVPRGQRAAFSADPRD
jgi:hypothetical protein